LIDGQLPGEAGAAGTSSEPVNPQQFERRVDSTWRRRRITKRLRQEISSPPQKKKGQPLSQDGWLFFFVPIAAEAVSVLKEAG
jgi:hypothetical protein